MQLQAIENGCVHQAMDTGRRKWRSRGAKWKPGLPQADGRTGEAIAWMRDAADEEDAIEKLPVTPGPIFPAREQLGSLLLAQSEPSKALKEFATALVNAPGRRGAIQGTARATELAGRK